jgi:hypothetical protein
VLAIALRVSRAGLVPARFLCDIPRLNPSDVIANVSAKLQFVVSGFRRLSDIVSKSLEEI